MATLIKPRRIMLGLFALVLSAALLYQTATTDAFSNGQAASLVLGADNFTSYSWAASQIHFGQPRSIVVDPATGKVFVADAANRRVKRYPARSALTNGAPAEAVLGQPNFTTNTAGTTAQTMRYPWGLAIDNQGRLWVADGDNNRVLRFDNAVSKPNGAPADGVLGQPNFTSSAAATTASGMSGPTGVAVDHTGRLWVSEHINRRVLRFDNAASKSNGAPADGVLGQPNFTSSGSAVSQSGLASPWAIELDVCGRLWVADYNNNRVLRFDAAASKPNGAPADGVLGQPNFTTNAAATSQVGMGNPIGISTDPAGRLFVAEPWNNRVIWFDAPASKPNGAPADGVLGQPNFTSSSNALTQQGLSSPSGLTTDASGWLWVADYGNNRVLLFDSQESNPKPACGCGSM